MGNDDGDDEKKIQVRLTTSHFFLLLLSPIVKAVPKSKCFHSKIQLFVSHDALSMARLTCLVSAFLVPGWLRGVILFVDCACVRYSRADLTTGLIEHVSVMLLLLLACLASGKSNKKKQSYCRDKAIKKYNTCDN